ncbi:hypothetical protein PHMEG_00024573 [Phytophthora megakarya]|uniref:Reverse transcriptase n=1 Tax=Phytophthora megakarya TaxID=4795 RepID=A0A225VEX0_9STRA|nr:hypothetical protein PHMEG_00024573 [Phytophthora megakarya]
MFHSNAKLPDEVSIPLIKTQAMKDEPEVHYEVSGPSATMNIPRREWMPFKVSKKHPSPKTHGKNRINSADWVTSYRKRWPYRVRLTNITDHTVYCPAHFPILAWVPLGHLPRDLGYVRLDLVKYTEWHVLAYAEARDKDLYKKEEKLYEQWLATQPSAVARPEYTYPTSILQHEESETASDNDMDGDRGDAQRSTMEESADIWVANTGVTKRASDDDSSCSEGSSDGSLELEFPEATPDPNSGSDFMILVKSFISVVKAIATKGYEFAEDDVIYVHEPADVELTGYAQELAFLPEFSDHSSTELDFSAANVMNSTISVDDQAKLVNVLKTHKNIMITSGNALPPPAYGVVWDINVEDHAPIKQRARRIPIRYLQKLYELLKGLLKANLASLSDSHWDSPIVIVLKKNGEDIRLCIDYKMVNSVTAIMEYAMPTWIPICGSAHLTQPADSGP